MTLAPEWIVEIAQNVGDGFGTPIFYPELKCTEVVKNTGSEPNRAKIEFKARRWNHENEFTAGNRVIVRSAGELVDSTILFDGVLTAWTPTWSSSNESSSHLCEDFRYVLGKAGRPYGQFVRPQSAYKFNVSEPPAEPPRIGVLPVKASGRRCVFNEDGKPNMDRNLFEPFTDVFVPLFGYLHRKKWTAKDMVVYLLTMENGVFNLFVGPQEDPNFSVGLDHADWQQEIDHVVVDSDLNIMEAVELIANKIGWQFRLDAFVSGGKIIQSYVFYQPGTATSRFRSETNPILLHRLYLPDNYADAFRDGVNATTDSLNTLIDSDVNLVQAGNVNFDTDGVVNNSIILGERQVFEITAELVPAWKDADFTTTIETSTWWTTGGSLTEDKLFYNDSELREFLKPSTRSPTDPNSKTFFKQYHVEGSSFGLFKNVGRKWALNEVGFYTDTSVEDRGLPFDFSSAIAGINQENVAYYPRKVLPSLTSKDKDGNTIKYLMEWTADGGANWHSLNDYSVEVLEDEWGLYITEPNISEIKYDTLTDAGIGGQYRDANQDAVFTNGEKPDITYWTSLAFDYENGNSFKDGEWQTRVRLTASLQLDHRLVSELNTLDKSGSKLTQKHIFDQSERHLWRNREASSVYSGSTAFPLGWWSGQDKLNITNTESLDPSNLLQTQHIAVDLFNRQAGFSGSFELSVINLSEGSGDWFQPRFEVGDCVEGIEGRGVSMKTTADVTGGVTRYANIEQIVYRPEIAQTTIVTNDLRKSFSR